MNSANNRVLIVDDEPMMRAALQANFRQDGWQVETASGVQEAIAKFSQQSYPLVVTDVRMPDGDGIQVMKHVRETSPNTAVILLTAYGTVPEAVQAIRSGAVDYIIKPVSFGQLRSVVQRVMQPASTTVANGGSLKTNIVGSSRALMRSLERAASAAQVDADVLVEAESGTGKELLARFIHYLSSRNAKPFIAVNCAAVPETLLESELFGHTRGAFTGATATRVGKFEAANGGTLLLDEIGEMPISLQPKLLRVLQEREFERLGEARPVKVDIRVIATTNVSLMSMVESGRFRADLYYRLNVIPLSLPPLRERKEDIASLAEHFVRLTATQAGRQVPRLLPGFISRLEQHAWPGNVRELYNLVRRVVLLNEKEDLGAEHLSVELGRPQLGTTEKTFVPERQVIAGSSMRHVERQLLESTLQLTAGNRTRAAEMLGISVRTIRNKIREYGLPPRRYA